ncbi:RraA family protein [Treponema primitia]|uniref:RraA family protein n=1 Tax=Treponema primitia TaxID=88058 RepID=UPI0039811CFC
MDKSIVERFSKLDTTSVSDAMDSIGKPCGLLGLKPVNPGTVICGRAFTVHYTPCGEVKGTVGDYLDDIAAGDVVVIDNGGRDYCTVWGDLMTIVADRNKVAGTVIDGVCRDIPTVRKLGYPLYSKGCYMVTGKDRVFVDYTGKPVSISGVQVKPGDIIIADDTGVICVPAELEEKLIGIAESIAEKEGRIEAAVRSGASLKAARESVGYHSLQTKK